jgi:hypothetical protein
MSESNSSENSKTAEVKKVTPLQCLTGATISGSLAYLLYLLTASIATSFATKPLPSGNKFVVKIAVAIRSLLVSTVSLGTFVFAIVALGLMLLGIQLLIQTVKLRVQNSEGIDKNNL